ncbi:SPOR domain-containing protein [Helicobacter sp. NHP22-001]|uniref:SPOR domain-containing protein n=1 Tax=Helicobacter sp. NHP22-001 TaxID=3040202 RepID=UPI00244D97B8|nr:SPOR domain-containing protein [Helicobacter sp. NHP22-001]GMB95653.1 Cell division protein ZipA [Helicobacter sp. NHP22-001]
MDKNEFSELEQGLNRRLNEVVNGHEEQKGSGLKKILLIVAIALIILVVVVLVFYKSTREPAKSASLPPEKNMQKVGNGHDFESLTLEPAVKKPEEDRFDKIVKDIQSKQNQSPTEDNNNAKLNALPASPLDRPTPTHKDIGQSAPTHKPVNKEHTEAHKEIHHEAHKPEQAHKSEHHEAHKAHQEAHKPTHHKKEAIHTAHKVEHKVESKAEHPVHKEKPAHATKHESKPVAKHPTAVGLPKGFYLQVGVFSKTPNTKFLEALKAYPHKVQDFKGQKRYLIGPFESKEKADEELEKVSKDVAKPVHVQIK